MNPRITISLPCLGRPLRTRRAIECIGAQNIDNWEALIVGDHCPVFQEILESQWFNDWKEAVEKRGNIVKAYNQEMHTGGYGHHITNVNIEQATGDYFVFYANDDVIYENHFQHYLAGIEGTGYDFVYYNSWVLPKKQVRYSNLFYGGIGHSELIIRTSFLKTLPKHENQYGHDWQLIQDMMKFTSRYRHAESIGYSYEIRSVPPNNTVDTID